jgi:hypothetical protein
VKACLILQDLSKVEDLNWDIKTPDKFTEHWSDWQVDLFQPAEMVSVSHFLQFKFFCFLNASGKVYASYAYVHITESVTDEPAREVNGGKRVVAVSLVTSKA